MEGLLPPDVEARLRAMTPSRFGKQVKREDLVLTPGNVRCKNPECSVCFKPNFPNQTYCTRRCVNRARYIRSRPPMWVPSILVCPVCGREFLPIVKKQIYCVESCFRKNQRQRPKNKIKALARYKRANAGRRQQNAETVLAAKLKAKCPCGKCDSDPDVLLFHHRDPATKCFSISWGVKSGVSMQRLLEEIAKCDLICSNYHIKLHKSLQQIRCISSSILDDDYKNSVRSTEKHRQKFGLKR